jgi:hypothetical protein
LKLSNRIVAKERATVLTEKKMYQKIFGGGSSAKQRRASTAGVDSSNSSPNSSGSSSSSNSSSSFHTPPSSTPIAEASTVPAARLPSPLHAPGSTISHLTKSKTPAINVKQPTQTPVSSWFAPLRSILSTPSGVHGARVSRVVLLPDHHHGALWFEHEFALEHAIEIHPVAGV